MSFKITGLDSLQKRLKDMERKARELDGTHEVRFADLFSSEFMRKHTQYETINDFFDATGFKLDSQQDFEDLPEDELDARVRELTDFQSWKDFSGKAAAHYASKQLGLS